MVQFTTEATSLLTDVNKTIELDENGLPYLPVLGLPGWNFYILHYTALVSLTISFCCSVAVFMILKPRFPSFWSRTAGERFAIYLAFADLGHSISHFSDHAYMVAIEDHPPEDACIAMGFFVSTFFYVQSLMVSVMAFNAFMLVVKERKVSLGKYDWKFVTITILFPAVLMTPCAALRWLGPAGGWCVADVRKEMGRIVAYVQSICMVVTMFVNALCYLFVWIKIKQVTKGTEAMGTSTRGNNTRAAGVMMKFVAAYIVQWTSNVIYYFWSLITIPPFATVHLVVFTCNIGGLLNLIAYTVGRRMGTGEKGDQGGNKRGDKHKNDTQSVQTIQSNVSH